MNANAEALTRYQIMEPLGQGRQGTTYRGVDRDTKRQVAIKVLSLRANRDWKAFDLFEREVAVLKSLDHPRVPKYLDSYASEETGDFFLVMELVEGKSLAQAIAAGRRFDQATLRRLLDDVLSVLQYLHGLSPIVVHRDVKPANLLLSPAGEVSLVDFGGVRRAIQGEGGSTVIGTFGYMAPEQLHGEATPAADIYALGATMVALAAGAEADSLPHDGLRLDVESLELPTELREVVGRMVEPDPRLRPASVADVRTLLGEQGRRLKAAPSRAQRDENPRVPDVVPAAAVPAALDPSRDIPAPIRALARVPFPASFLVWLVASIASGTLVVFEIAVLPLIAMLAFAINDRSKRPEARKELESNLDELRDTATSTRRAFSWVADSTSPVRDRDRALPPPKK